MFWKHRKLIPWLLIVGMTYSPAMVLAQPPVGAKKAAKNKETPPKDTETAKARPAAEKANPAKEEKQPSPTESPASVETSGSAASKPKVDLGYVTPDAVAAVVAYPRHVLTSPQMEMLPLEMLSASGRKEWGIDPLQIEQALLIAEPPTGMAPEAALVLRLATPLPLDEKVLGPLQENTTEDQIDGKPYRKAGTPMSPSIFRPDDRTIVIATDELLKKLVANHADPKEGRMSKMLARMTDPPDLAAIMLIEPVRPLMAMSFAMVPVPPACEDAKKIVDLVASVGLKLNLTGDMPSSLTLRANDEAAAEQLEQIINQLMEEGRKEAVASAEKEAADGDPMKEANVRYVKRIAERLIQLFRPVRNGKTLTMSPGGDRTNPQMASTATTGILVALLLPAVQAAREAAKHANTVNNLRQVEDASDSQPAPQSPENPQPSENSPPPDNAPTPMGSATPSAESTRGAAQDAKATDNMKQILLAILNHEAAIKTLPPRAIFGKKDGKPLLSWRVHILPYLGEQELYKQFHLDEPWDSEHNKTLIAMMPKAYRVPSSKAAPGMTTYLAACGKRFAFDGDKGRRFKEFTDGTNNTILVLEVNDDHAVFWTKPDDWQYDARAPMTGLGDSHAGKFNVGFADGSTRLLPKELDSKTFLAMLSIDGGEKNQ